MSSGIFTDYYEDLQISPNADNENLERVYRLLAKRYHPDNGQTGSVERFDMITQAYQILSKPEKRAAYDAKYEEEKVSLDKYTIIEESRTRVVYNWLQYFSRESLGKEFEENGFEVENFYLNVAGDPFDSNSTEFALVARKL